MCREAEVHRRIVEPGRAVVTIRQCGTRTSRGFKPSTRPSNSAPSYSLKGCHLISSSVLRRS